MWVCVVWCCVVRKYRDSKKKLENCQNTGSVLARYGQPWTQKKKVRKRPSLPTHCFLHFPWDLLTFSDKGSYSKRPKNIFHLRSHSKGPNRALEQVQTNETPCTSWRTSCLPLPIRWAPVGRQFETTHASHCRAPPSVPWTSASANSWKGWTGRRNSWPNWSISSPWPPPSFSFVFSSAGVVHQERRIRHQRHCAAVNSGFLGGQQQHKSPLHQPPTTPHTIRTWLPQAPSTASQHDTQPEPLLRTLQDTLMQPGVTRGLDLPRTPQAPGSGSLVRRRTRFSFYDCDADLVRKAVQDWLRLRIPFLVTDTQGPCAAKISTASATTQRSDTARATGTADTNAVTHVFREDVQGAGLHHQKERKAPPASPRHRRTSPAHQPRPFADEWKGNDPRSPGFGHLLPPPSVPKPRPSGQR